MAAGIDPPARIGVHGFLLVGGEKMSKSSLTGIASADPDADLRGGRLPLPLPPRPAFGPDGDFSYEGMVSRYNADLANNLSNLLARVITVVERKCGGVRPAPDLNSRLAVVAASAYETAAGAWSPHRPGEALGATWRLVRGRPAPPWRLPSPGRPNPARPSTPLSMPADAPTPRRHPVQPGLSAGPPGRSGAAWACPDGSTISGCPTGRLGRVSGEG